MLFDLQTLRRNMLDNPEKSEIITGYEKDVEPIAGKEEIQDLLFYKDYVAEFQPITYRVPPELTDDFDWGLLLQLGAASFSTEVELQRCEDTDAEGVGLIDLRWVVTSGEQTVTKTMLELWGFQIIRLYDIFVEEQLNLARLMAESEREKAAILAQREACVEKWKAKMQAHQEARFIDILKSTFGMEEPDGQ